MAGKVDTGKIIKVRRFPVYPEDGVEEILKRTYENQMALFLEIASLMSEGKELSVSKKTWTRPPFSRKQFDELFKITPDMSEDEVKRKIRAISYKHWQPYVEIHGHRFEYKAESKK